MKLFFGILFVALFSCDRINLSQQFAVLNGSDELDTVVVVPMGFEATKFDFPVGKPNAAGYYNAQGFGKNNHLGDDWNGLSGGNSDLGDPIYAIANGLVTTAKDLEGGWGNVIRITHYLPSDEVVQSIYAHCDSLHVAKGTWVKIGDQIGTIGTAHGQYRAHLHLEIRDSIHMGIGPGYSTNTAGYLDPYKFIKAHRTIE